MCVLEHWQFGVELWLCIIKVFCVKFDNGWYTISRGGVAQEPNCVAFVRVSLAVWDDQLLNAMDENYHVIGGYSKEWEGCRLVAKGQHKFGRAWSSSFCQHFYIEGF